MKDEHNNASNTQTVNLLNDLFYRDGQMIGIAAEESIRYNINRGNFVDYLKPFSIPAFTSADVY